MRWLEATGVCSHFSQCGIFIDDGSSCRWKLPVVGTATAGHPSMSFYFLLNLGPVLIFYKRISKNRSRQKRGSGALEIPHIDSDCQASTNKCELPEEEFRHPERGHGAQENTDCCRGAGHCP